MKKRAKTRPTIHWMRNMPTNKIYKCEVCGHGDYLVLVIGVKDVVCEGCGAWQDAEFNDIWERVS